MKAAIFREFSGPLNIEDIDTPACPPNGVIVKVEACGVCRSDVHAWQGVDPDVSPPHVPGHEFAGIVEEAGPDCTRYRKGDRVTAPFILACGECHECLGGDPTVCDHQHVLGFSGHGAFAQYCAVPHADFNLVRLPDAIGFVEAAGMGCRVSTAFRGIVDRAKLQPGETMVVHGCGGVGLSAIMIGAAMGAKVIAVDIDEAALKLATGMGASETLNASSIDDVGNAVRERTGGGAHVSIEGLGVTATFHNSVRSLRKLGRHVQIGMPVGAHANPVVPLLETVYSRQIQIMGTRGIAASRFPAMLTMVESGKIDPARLIKRTVALNKAGEALAELERFASPGVTVIDQFDA